MNAWTRLNEQKTFFNYIEKTDWDEFGNLKPVVIKTSLNGTNILDEEIDKHVCQINDYLISELSSSSYPLVTLHNNNIPRQLSLDLLNKAIEKSISPILILVGYDQYHNLSRLVNLPVITVEIQAQGDQAFGPPDIFPTYSDIPVLLEMSLTASTKNGIVFGSDIYVLNTNFFKMAIKKGAEIVQEKNKNYLVTNGKIFFNRFDGLCRIRDLI